MQSPTSRLALDADCAYIVDKGVFGAGLPGLGWHGSTRKGLVMGSVQSGKTASMLGVVARSLDAGVDVVVILAGTRVSLWQQTFDRVRRQLDVPRAGETAVQARRLLLPKSPPLEAVPLSIRYQLTRPRVARNLQHRQPILVVALKNTSHLQALRQSFTQSLFPEIEAAGKPVHMLVLDDEADDASILDAKVEASQDPLFGELKQIPRSIVDLWSPPTGASPTQLFTTYIGYTATPQANFLQEEHNPLSPRDFVLTLRTPLDHGDLNRRSSTYAEPLGLAAFYTGGEVYYRRGGGAGLCQPTTGRASHDLADALRAYLVAGAVRLARSTSRLGPSTARFTAFNSRDEAISGSPEPHTMLIHPSAVKSEHFTVAEDVLLWAGADPSAARSLLEEGGFLPSALVNDVRENEFHWKKWRDSFAESAGEIQKEFSTRNPGHVPDWETVRQALETEVIPGTRVAVVNSDPGADDSPEFAPVEQPDGSWRAGRDISTIFVSGNVMSRGLTLEGLTTTLFHRNSSTPAADTQMQMQRWFGYRGTYIELCRVFAAPEQLRLFAAYHDVDEAIRNVIAEAMEDDAPPPTPVVLAGRDFMATAKIANLNNKGLHPGRKPFIRFVNSGERPDPNARMVTDLFRSAPSTSVSVSGRVRGRILDSPLDLVQAAELIDRLTYESYVPGRESQIGEMWSQLEQRIAAVQPLPEGQTLYRAPAPIADATPTPVVKDCPYSVSAYLRLWQAATTRHVRGLFVNDQNGDRWSMVDLELKRTQVPRFWVGIRFGGLNGPTAPAPLDELPFSVPTTDKDVEGGVIKTTWGSNDPDAGALGYRGDEFFDYDHRGRKVPEAGEGFDSWRPPGDDGLILFYVNQRAGQTHPAIAVGLCIPAGGPDQFAAYVSSTRD